jgi:4,5-dihydroxyphthalate decarboxylase
VPFYGITAVMTARGILADEYGVTPEDEQVYYKKTRIFPIMHVLGIKTEVLERDKSLALRVYKGFCDAKDVCLRDLDGDGGAVKAKCPGSGPSSRRRARPWAWISGLTASRRTGRRSKR